MLLKRVTRFVDKFSRTNNKIYIMPTKLGFIFTGIMFTLFLIGLTYGNNLTLSVAFILFTYFVMQMLDTHKNISMLNPQTFSISNNFANQNIVVNMINEGPILEDAYKFELNENVFFTLKTNLNQLHGISKIKRGVYRGFRCKLSNGGKSGLFYSWKYHAHKYEFYVYPEPLHSQINNEFDINLNDLLSEEDEFDKHKPYVPGISSKRIDWKIFARNDQLFWKKYIGNTKGEIKLDYSNIQGSNEEKLSILAYLLTYAFKQNFRWSLILPNEKHTDCSNQADLKHCLMSLARFKA